MKATFYFVPSFILPLLGIAQSHSSESINSDAPVVQSKSVVIDADPKKVWQVLTAIEDWGTWNSRIKEPKLKSKLSLKSSFSWKINGAKINSTIETLIAEKTLGWSGKTFGAKALHYWYLEPVKGGTQVLVKESMEGWLIALMRKKMNKTLADDMEYWLEQLKIECERN